MHHAFRADRPVLEHEVRDENGANEAKSIGVVGIRPVGGWYLHDTLRWSVRIGGKEPNPGFAQKGSRLRRLMDV